MSCWAIICFILTGVFIVINTGFFIACTIGGFFDLMHLFKSLKEAKVDETDDGRVIKQ